jgi:GT2 family glycosyltransferase
LIIADPAIPFLSVLIVNYNGVAHLEECLSSVVSQDFRDFEIVLVDNGSADGSAAFVRDRFPDVRLVESGVNLGFAGGNNLGLTHCRGEFVFFLNNDTRLESGALRNLAAGLAEFPAVRAFACLMLTYRNPAVVDNAGETFYTTGLIVAFAGYPASQFSAVREVNGACGGAAVYARSLLDEIGAFDEVFFLLHEDTDLSLRTRRYGERILFLPGVRVLHKGSASIGGSLSATAVYFASRNMVPLFIKNFPVVTILKLSPGIAFSLFVRLVQATRRGLLRVFLKGLWNGLKLAPGALRYRRENARLRRADRAEFERLFRPGWIRERLAFRRGDFSGVP